MRRTFGLLLLGAVGLTALWASARVADPTSATLARDYKKLKDLTPDGFQTTPALMFLCVGISPEHIAHAEKSEGPHAYSRIHVYVNPLAEKAIAAAAKAFPVGAVVIKEKQVLQPTYRPGRSGAVSQDLPVRRNGVTGMIKRARGYDPQNGDWEYFIQYEGGKLETGKIPTCIGCHAKAKGPDHLFATWYAKRPGPLPLPSVE